MIGRSDIAAALFAAALVIPSGAGSEEVVLDPVPNLLGQFSISSRTITLSKDGSPDLHVSEIVSPLLVRRPIGRDADVTLYLSGASATSDGDLQDSEMNGFNDVEISGSKRFDSGKYWLGGGINLPTGAAEVKTDQLIVTGIVANRILGLRLKRFGDGFDFFLSGARAFELGRAVVASVGAGYQYKGEYDYQKGEDGDETISIKPGDAIFFAAGIGGDLTGRSRTISWKGDVRYRLFSKDERNGEAIYEEGDQIEFLASGKVHFADERWISSQIFVVVKGDGSEVAGVGEGNIETMSLEEYLRQGLPGGLQQAELRYGQRMSDRVDLQAHTVFSHYSEYSFPGTEPEERLLGSAKMFDLGAGVVYFLAENSAVVMQSSFLVGSAEGGAVDMNGFDLAVTFRWKF